MLDLGYVREHLDLIGEKLRQRGMDPDEVLGSFRSVDAKRREAITQAEQLKAQRNKASEEVAKLKKTGQDASALIEEAYDLEVSSPGLDRQLRKDREFRWAAGKRVRCWLAGGEEIRGRLVGVDDDQVVIDRDGAEVRLTRASITKTKLDADVPWEKRSA